MTAFGRSAAPFFPSDQDDGEYESHARTDKPRRPVLTALLSRNHRRGGNHRHARIHGHCNRHLARIHRRRGDTERADRALQLFQRLKKEKSQAASGGS